MQLRKRGASLDWPFADALKVFILLLSCSVRSDERWTVAAEAVERKLSALLPRRYVINSIQGVPTSM